MSSKKGSIKTLDTLIRQSEERFDKEFGVEITIHKYDGTIVVKKVGDEKIKSFLSSEIRRVVEELTKKMESTYTWVQPVKKTKKAGVLRKIGDAYLHIEWKDWEKFKSQL